MQAVKADSNRNIARARAHSNIAFIKYWGNRDQQLRLPASSSLSMNLADLYTTTEVEWSASAERDSVSIDGVPATGAVLARVQRHLHALRRRFDINQSARVTSRNNFPMGAGLASSAAAFAALTLAATAALRADVTEKELTSLARLGSGSAARSIPAGYVQWHRGDSHESSFAESIAAPEHWQLVDVIALVSRAHKSVGSTRGHASAASSILQEARIRSAGTRLAALKRALLQRDFATLARITEEESNLMHAVMMTSQPPLFYWEPQSLRIMRAVRRWRLEAGIQVCYTLDAGPNVHCICLSEHAAAVADRLGGLLPGIEILQSKVGGGATVLGRESALG